MVNLEKSNIMFSPSINPKKKTAIIQAIHFKVANKWWKHLGIPMNGSKIPTHGFNDLVGKIEGLLVGWRSKLHSFAGKIMLIKLVILFIPNYVMAGSKVPTAVLRKIKTLMRNFLWNHDHDKRKMHLIDWDQISKPKEEGGLGIFRLADLRKALMCKNLFQLLSLKDQVWVQWIYSSYNLNEELWRPNCRGELSPLMGSIFKAQWPLKEGIFYRNDDSVGWKFGLNQQFSIK